MVDKNTIKVTRKRELNTIMNDEYQKLQADKASRPDSNTWDWSKYNAARDELESMGHVSDSVQGALKLGTMRPDVSAKLRDAGIPGIRYLDGGSRAGGQGTSNYVAFNPAQIEILRKYMNGHPASALPGISTGHQQELTPEEKAAILRRFQQH